MKNNKTSIKYSENNQYISRMLMTGFTDPIDYSIDERRRIVVARSHKFEQRKGAKRRYYDRKAKARRIELCKLRKGDSFNTATASKLGKSFQGGALHDDSRDSRIYRENHSNSKVRLCAKDIRALDMMASKMEEYAEYDAV